MDKYKKPVTSEEFNRMIRKEKGLPERKEVKTKPNSVIGFMVMVFVLSYITSIAIRVACVVVAYKGIEYIGTEITSKIDKESKPFKIGNYSIEIKKDC